MYRFLFGFLLLISAHRIVAQNNINIIPKPLSVESRPGAFIINENTRIYYENDSENMDLPANYLAGLITPNLRTKAFSGKTTDNDLDNVIYFLEDKTLQNREAYTLEVGSSAIFVRAKTAAGAFYAVQTLRQLLPNESFAQEADAKLEKRISACKITDAPRFGYRGLHLDVGRHFFPVDFVKRYIDLLAMHKLNTFHWHLTEDQGWRIEIKKYPNLHKTAAFRKGTLIGHYSDQPHQFEDKRYGGFYTQEEIKDVLAYAAQRFVTVIPEIEMPGHALAALAAYPELGCTGGPYEVAQLWGVFDDVFCAGNEKTFNFIENVLAEVCELFPGPYIHIGGDECPKTRWEACPKCKKRMTEHNLKDGHELQSYFIRRVEKMLSVRGKKLIGWDEILEGGLAPGATVMSWRGIEGGIAAAREHHDVIMTPGSHCYFDHYQSDPANEPVAIGGFTTLEKAYAYEPVPAELNAEEAQYIMGAQANVWTEYMPNSAQVEYMAYPRVCALAEVVWTAKEKKNWNDFSTRIKVHFARLDAMGVNSLCPVLIPMPQSDIPRMAVILQPMRLCIKPHLVFKKIPF
jgi:hexosaminidase